MSALRNCVSILSSLKIFKNWPILIILISLLKILVLMGRKENRIRLWLHLLLLRSLKDLIIVMSWIYRSCKHWAWAVGILLIILEGIFLFWRLLLLLIVRLRRAVKWEREERVMGKVNVVRVMRMIELI